MLGHPKPKEYTAIEDEETANLSETESNEDFLQHKNRRYVRSRQSVWVPWVRCNTAGTILLVAIAAAAVSPLYDYYWGSRGYGFAPPAVFARRLNHCVDVLQQHLMCHADLEPFVSNWRVGQEKPYADFAVRKTCVDFDYLLEWSERHKDPRHTELWKTIQKPEGALEREAPEGLPQITNDTGWSENGLFPVANLTGLGGKEYCLSPAS